MAELATDLHAARVGVLAGGDPHPHLVWPVVDRIHSALTNHGYDAVVIDLEREGFVNDLADIDVGFVAHWGRVGDTGRVQGTLELLGIPYTCSGAIACGVAKDKVKSKKLFRYDGLATPDFVEVDSSRDLDVQIDRLVEVLGLPLVAKPVYEGGSYGLELCESINEVREAFASDAGFRPRFAERFLPGRGFTVGILEDAGGVILLPPNEMVFADGRPFLDPVELYTPGMSWSEIPGEDDRELMAELKDLALRAHRAVGAYGLSRTDFKLDASGCPQVLEVNPLPALTAMSDLPFGAERVGISFDDLVERILRTAVERPVSAR